MLGGPQSLRAPYHCHGGSCLLTFHYVATRGSLATDLENRSSDEDDIFKRTHHTNGKTLSLDRFNADQPECTAVIRSRVRESTETINFELGRIFLRYIREIDIGQSSIGDICAAHRVLDDVTNIIMVVVYISPNNTINNIVKFLYKRVMIYGRAGSEEVENYHTLPLILAGDFNANFASEDGHNSCPRAANPESMITLPNIQSESNLLALSQAKNSKTSHPDEEP
ncbi:ATP-dependent DNA helicase [Trichonephila clavipes]|nr:ATP-dependent DNA helicase [Trichonephila clavipes]